MPAWPSMVGLASMAGLLVLGARALDEQECGNLGECLGNGIASLALASLVAPVVVLVGMLLLRFPRRDLLVVPLLVVAPQLLWKAVEFLESANPVVGTGWLLWVFAEAAVVLAGWVLVRRAPTPLAWRVLPLALVVALVSAHAVVEERIERRDDIEAVRAVPVTLRLVDLGSEFEVARVWAGRGYVSVDYRGRGADNHAQPEVSLVPAADATACEAAEVARPLGFDAMSCNGDPFLTTAPGHTAVGLTRGDTVLVASFSTESGLEAQWVREQLLAAPEVDAEELVP